MQHPSSDRIGRVVIAGGYGSVGREAAGRLAAVLPGQVTIAGRDLDRARASAATVGHGAEARST